MMTDFGAFTRRGFGVVGIRVAAAATLYSSDTASPSDRERIAAWLEEQRSRFGDALHWGRNPRSGRWQRANRCRPVTDWLPELAPAKPWEVLFHGGDDSRDANDALLAGFGAQDWNGGWGYLQWARPGAEVEVDPTGFRDEVIAAASTLRPSHGHAGWAVLQSPEIEFEQAFQPDVWALAQRHVGLDIGIPISLLDQLRSAIKGAAWLVVLDESWLARCPDVLALDGQDEIEVHHYPGGVVVQAGAGPTLGGALGEPPPRPLATLARAIAPIRLRQHPGFHVPGPGRMEREDTLRWLGRFDEWMDAE